MKNMFAGVDLGSTSIKAVVLDGDLNIAGLSITASGTDYQAAGQKVLAAAMAEAGCCEGDLKNRITTGYGRFTAGATSHAVSEITCCGWGAGLLLPHVDLVIDIGGQDCKAIKVASGGKVTNFALNDKCAAGTGRFLERIALSLGLDLAEMAKISMKATGCLPVSNTCTVFAETEVISRVSSGEPVGDIVRGLHVALANRISTLVGRIGKSETRIICGGGAKNAALVKELGNILGDLNIPQQVDPRYVPAIGAAIIARNRYMMKGVPEQ